MSVEAEIGRLEPLLGPFGPEVAELTGVGVGALIDALHQCASLAPRWMCWILDFADRVERIDDLVPGLREHVASRPRTVVPDLRRGCSVSLTQLRAESGHVPARAFDALVALIGHRAEDAVAGSCYLEQFWELRRRPVLVAGDRLTVPVGYNLVVAFRPAVERLLRRTARVGARYERAKGKWVEARALEVLTSKLRPDQRLRALDIPAEDGDRAERDGLLVIDSVALAIEVKGGGMPPSAQLGHGSSQRRVIDRLLLVAGDQASSLLAALADGVTVTGVDEHDRRGPVDLPDVSRWVPVVITLEDVSGVTSRGQLVFGNGEIAPWVVCLDELEWYATSLALPAQLAHYALVRGRLVSDKVAVMDEGDWFRLYHALGAVGCLRFVDEAAGLAETVLMHAGDLRRGRRCHTYRCGDLRFMSS